MSKILLVLDRLEYKKKANQYKNVLLEKFNDAEIVYTEYEDDTIRKVRKWKYIGSQMQHLLYWRKSYKYAKEILKKGAVTIICINPIVGIFLGMMNRNREVKLILCGFLFEPKKNKIYYNLRKKFSEFCLVGTDMAVVYAEQEVEYYKKIFGETGNFVYVPYGIDYMVENEYQGELPKSFFFSGGGSNRDYQTLISAYEELLKRKKVEHMELCIATLPHCLAGQNTESVHILTDVVLETFGDVMKHSRFMVLSLKETDLSAGHQVLLEALKNNVIIIVNRIRAVEDYVGDKQVIYYQSGNILDLCDKIEYVIQNYEQVQERYSSNETFYREHYTFSSLLKRLMKLDILVN